MKIIYYAPENLSLKKEMPLDLAPKRRTFFIKQALEKKAEVFTICGDKNERIELIEKFYKKYTFSEFDGMYIESTNWPLRFFDYIFFYKASRKMPVTIFYRDCYWKFPKTYFKINSFNRLISYLRFIGEFIFFKKIMHHFFFPSKNFDDLLKVKSFSSLPPGANKIVDKKDIKLFDEINLFYAGRLGYGFEILYDVIKELEKRKVKFKFYIISVDDFNCKSKNVIQFKSHFNNHFELIKKMHIGLIPRKSDTYLDTAIPFKVVDYMAFGLPIITVNNSALKDFVETRKIGFAVGYDVKSICDAVEKFSKNPQIWNDMKNRIDYLIQNDDSWDSRAETILETIKKLKK